MDDTVRLVDAREDCPDCVPADMNIAWTPADGGRRAWTVVACCAVANGIISGFTYISSVIFTELLQLNQGQEVSNLATQTSLVLSLAAGLSFLLCLPASILVDKIGYQASGVLGGVLAFISLLSSSWLLTSITGLYFSFSFICGLAYALAEVASVPLLGFYFRRRLGLVNGLVAASSSIFAVIISYCIQMALPVLGLSGVFRIFSGVMLATALFALAYVLPEDAPKTGPMRGWELINTKIWKNRKYVVWCLSISFAWFGFFIPFVHIVKHATVNFPTKDGYVLTTCLNIVSIASRIVFGVIADLGFINIVTLQQGTLVLAGLFTLLVPLVTSWPLMVCLTLLIGMLNGGIQSLVGPICTNLCGVTGAVQALGFMYGVNTIPFIAGPAFAGYIFDNTQSYTVAFLVSGGSIIVSGLLMFFVRVVKSDRTSE